MIMGYEMYRNLTHGRNIKSKKLKETFQKTLVDPGTVLAHSIRVVLICPCFRSALPDLLVLNGGRALIGIELKSDFTISSTV